MIYVELRTKVFEHFSVVDGCADRYACEAELLLSAACWEPAPDPFPVAGEVWGITAHPSHLQYHFGYVKSMHFYHLQ